MKSLNRKLIILIFFVLAGKFANAQETLNFAQVNEKTYSFYLEGDWKNLVKIGKQAKKEGIDFYYLNVRMGIAYYNQKKYRQSIPYFEMAFRESPGEEFIIEYLYYAYLFSGRKPDARNLSYSLSSQQLEKLKIKAPIGLSGIEFETKVDKWDEYAQTGSVTDTVQQSVLDSYYYYGATFDFISEKGNKFILSYSRIGISETSQWLNSSNQMVISDRKIGQNQIYLSSQTRLAKGLNMAFSANILYLSLKEDITILQSTLKSTTGFGPGSGGGGIIGGSGGIFSNYNALTGSNFDFVGFFSLTQDFSLFRAGVFGSFSGLDNNLQIQPGIGITFYPLGNTNLYTHTNFQYLFEKTDYGNDSRILIKQSLGLNLWGLYLEPSMTFGRLNNLIEANGYIVNNYNDIPFDRYEILAYTYLFRGRLNLFFNYQNFMMENYYILNNETRISEYKYQTITGGIKWNF
jgi:hypothetical protein